MGFPTQESRAQLAQTSYSFQLTEGRCIALQLVLDFGCTFKGSQENSMPELGITIHHKSLQKLGLSNQKTG